MADVGYKTWMCLICGWVYDEESGVPEEGIAPGTRWEDVPINWTCPECGARKEDFEMVQICRRGPEGRGSVGLVDEENAR